MQEQSHKKYLGDGVEMNYDGHQVILTGQTGRVYLKPQIVKSFKSALNGLKEDLKKSKFQSIRN